MSLSQIPVKIWFATCGYLNICNNSWFNITRICLKLSQKQNVKGTVSTLIKYCLMTGKVLHLRDCQCHLKAKYYDNLNYVLWEYNITTIYLQRIQYCSQAWHWSGMQRLSIKYYSTGNITVQLQMIYFCIVFLCTVQALIHVPWLNDTAYMWLPPCMFLSP
jgi:hypothetical protein